MNNKLQKALELSEEILENIELESEKLTSIVLKCLRLARLVNDNDAVGWLSYENGTYKGNNERIEAKAYKIAVSHGRKTYNEKGKECVFTDTIGSLESRMEVLKSEIKSYSTQGFSVSGEKAYIATNSFTRSISNSISKLNQSIGNIQTKIDILKGEYYKYALNINMELGFSKSAEDIFGRYREIVDNKLSNVIGDSEEKLSAIYDRLTEDNKESWSQAADTCRKLFKSVADSLFDKMYPNYTQKTLTVKSGKDVDITGDKYLNRLTVCLDSIDKLSNKHIEDTISWISKLNDKICNGVHNDITYREIQQIIIHTYICLGDIISSALLDK